MGGFANGSLARYKPETGLTLLGICLAPNGQRLWQEGLCQSGCVPVDPRREWGFSRATASYTEVVSTTPSVMEYWPSMISAGAVQQAPADFLKGA